MLHYIHYHTPTSALQRSKSDVLVTVFTCLDPSFSAVPAGSIRLSTPNVCSLQPKVWIRMCGPLYLCSVALSPQLGSARKPPHMCSLLTVLTVANKLQTGLRQSHITPLYYSCTAQPKSKLGGSLLAAASSSECRDVRPSEGPSQKN